jgi:hypothetical protein
MKKHKASKNKAAAHNEQYIIRYDYLKPDGYWLRHQYMDIEINLSNHPNEKNNHDAAYSLAEEKLKELYKQFKITRVSLC